MESHTDWRPQRVVDLLGQLLSLERSADRATHSFAVEMSEYTSLLDKTDGVLLLRHGHVTFGGDKRLRRNDISDISITNKKTKTKTSQIVKFTS